PIFGKREDVLDGRRTERVDRLSVVADDADARAVRLHRVHDVGLKRVRILILVDQHVLETIAELARDPRLLDENLPIEQQVVVIENVLALLDLDVAAVETREVVDPLAAPREALLERLAERLRRIHAMRVDRKARILA